MFPPYLKQTLTTCPQLDRADRVLSGLEAALLTAVIRALRLKPCQKKMPCLGSAQKTCRFNLPRAISSYWQLASPEEQIMVRRRLMHLLYCRCRGFASYVLLEHRLEESSSCTIFQTDFDDWCEQKSKRINSPLRLIVALIRLQPQASQEEIAYFLDPAGSLTIARLNTAWLHLLIRVCHQVSIVRSRGKKVLLIQFSPSTEPRVI